MARFARKTSRKTLKGHFRPSLHPFPSTYAKDVSEEAISYTRCAGVLGLLGSGIRVFQLYRAPIWFLTAVSFTERTALTAPALAYNKDQVTLGGCGEKGCSPREIRQNNRKWHKNTQEKGERICFFPAGIVAPREQIPPAASLPGFNLHW